MYLGYGQVYVWFWKSLEESNSVTLCAVLITATRPGFVGPARPIELQRGD